MGNGQSVESDEDSKKIGDVKYNYYQHVLKEAKDEAPNGGDYVADNEQYFSADEGESDVSLTPPRNRPESSSSENSSADEKVEENSFKTPQPPQAKQTPYFLRNASSNKTSHLENSRFSTHGNSSFDEHDSIGPELDTSLDLSGSNRNSVRTTTRNLRSSSRLTQYSPFIPIKSPSPVSQSNRIDNKALQVSPTKRRLGYVDSSDEDEDKVIKQSLIKKQKSKPTRLNSGECNFSHTRSPHTPQKHENQEFVDVDFSDEKDEPVNTKPFSRQSPSSKPARSMRSLRYGAFHPPKRKVSPPEKPSVNDVAHTKKMGLCIRNENGKVFPCVSKSNSLQPSSSVSDTTISSSSIDNISNILKSNKSHSRLNQNKTLTEQNEAQISPKTWGSVENTNPLKNFVLTPSSTASLSNTETKNLQNKFTEDLHVLSSDSSSLMSLTDNRSPQGKSLSDRKRKSATDRFKDFWQDKNISSNFMSLFAKESSPESIQTNLQSSSKENNQLNKRHSLQTEIRNSSEISENRTQQPTSVIFSHSFQEKSDSYVVTDSQSTMDVRFLPQTSPFQVLHFKLANCLDVSVEYGIISEQTTAGIVNWTDGQLTHKLTDCSRRIVAKAGALLRAACNDYLDNKGGELEPPEVLTTPAGRKFGREVEAILHVVCPPFQERSEKENCRMLAEVYANCLRYADEKEGLPTLSFPLLGEGVFPSDLCVEIFLDSLFIHIHEQRSRLSETKLCSVSLVVGEPALVDFTEEMMRPLLQTIQEENLLEVADRTYKKYFSRSKSSELCQHEDTHLPSGRPKLKRPRL